MYIYCYLCKTTTALLIFILIDYFIIECAGKTYRAFRANRTYCPYIETVSFGSEIDIKCNDSYFIFNETSPDPFNWKFANQTHICNRNGTQEAFAGQCGVLRINAKYLRVQLKSSKYYENACIYCRVNYVPITPSISVTQSNDDDLTFYTFNITATKLGYNESFEILSAKRASDENRHSINYWFSRKCIHSTIQILENKPHTIVFGVDDVPINRVEFIIRRCNDTCRSYDTCNEEEFLKDVAFNYLKTPDSIEKLTCDYDCLSDASITGITDLPLISIFTQLTTETSLKPQLTFEHVIKLLIIIVIFTLLIATLVVCIVYKMREKKHIYSKTNNAEPDEIIVKHGRAN